jgi:hypothetical protein
MPQARIFDHDECRALYATGEWTQARLAEKYGVSASRIYQVVTPHVAARRAAYARRWSRGPCEKCGGECVRAGVMSKRQHSPDGRQLCQTCRRVEMRKKPSRDKDGALVFECGRCLVFKPLTQFGARVRRRIRAGQPIGNVGVCTACATAARRAYRERNKVPCSHGCGTMVLHENGGKDPECHPCSLLRIHGRLAHKVAA